MPGQADSAPSVDDIASFLVDNPSADSHGDDAPGGNEPGDEPDNSEPNEDPDGNADPEADPDSTDPDAEDNPDEPEEDDEPKNRQGLKFKVPVKGDDGADTTIEVDEKELIAGYQRRKDYTRKTQELAQKEAEVVSTYDTRMKEGREHLVKEIVRTRSAIQRLAALKSDDELAALAATDPSAYTSERARKDAITGVLREIDDQMYQAEEQWRAEQKEREAKEFASAWAVLGKHGINKEKLGRIFESVSKAYDIPMKDFANVRNPKVVQIMRDAAELQEIKAKAAALRKAGKTPKAPQLPQQRQQAPAARGRDMKALNQKFRSGKAGIGDLARLL